MDDEEADDDAMTPADLPSLAPSSASEEDDDDDDNKGNDSSDDNKEDDVPGKRKKATKYSPHCDVNFVLNTPYKLLIDDTKKAWGSALFLDPQPKVPASRTSSVKVGDYVLIRGKDITLVKTKGCKANFSATDEFVLTKDWAQFDDDMTGADLQGLDDIPFLLWWQSILPPVVKIPKKSAAVLEAEKKKKKKR